MWKSSSLTLMLCVAASGAVDTRVVTNWDTGWLFFRGDAPQAKEREFDDHAWTKVTLPHDWSIDGPFDQKNPAGGAGAFLPAGVGWYRKHFPVPRRSQAQRYFIEFDGVMANSDVWINGVHLGHR